MTAYFNAMRRYFDFSGRSTRSQFWLFTLVYTVLLIAGIMLDAILMIDPTGQALVITGVISLVHLIPSLSVLVRRLHDIDRSGWWILIGFVPLVGLIMLIIFACTPSQAGGPAPNAYGRRDPNMAMPSPQAANLSASAVDQLEKLSALRASGALSDEEFSRMKAQLLQRTTQ